MTEINNESQEVVYTFRFTASNQRLQLNQNQLDRIPYLSALVTHKDDFLSIRNENGEYVLNPPIHYNWLVAVLHSITSEQAYTLFTELPEDDNILGSLQLFDYLGVNSFDPPLLKGKDLVLSSPPDTSETRRVEYHRANVTEARNTAAEFIIAVSNNVYDLLDLHTVYHIFHLILTILYNADVFSSRFRHHTLTIAKECCWIVFSQEQQCEVIRTHQTTQKHRKLNSFMYLYDDTNSLPYIFWNAFSWRGVYMSAVKNDISLPSAPSRTMNGNWSNEFSISILSSIEQFYRFETLEDVTREQKKKRAQSARSGYFKMASKPVNIDQFKHRSTPKAQKYR